MFFLVAAVIWLIGPATGWVESTDINLGWFGAVFLALGFFWDPLGWTPAPMTRWNRRG
jgi:hypothetical protein